MPQSKGPRAQTRLNPKQQDQFTRSFDDSFRRGWRSDAPSIAFRMLVIALAYALLARAIADASLGPGYVALVFLGELLALMWLGWALARTVVREPVFQQVTGKIWVPIGWTLAVATPYALVLIFQSGGDWPLAQSQLATWGERAWSSGLLQALGAALAGLTIDTVGDVRRWQRRERDEAFVWPATMQVGFRFAAILALPFLLLIPVIAFGSVANMLCAGSGNSRIEGASEYVNIAACFNLTPDMTFSERMSWTLFAWLLAAELLVLFGGAWLHRRMLRKNPDAVNDGQR